VVVAGERADKVEGAGEHRGAGMRDEVAAVGDYVHATDQATTVRFQGALRCWDDTMSGDAYPSTSGGSLRGFRRYILRYRTNDPC
jgi:hypothetical protein